MKINESQLRNIIKESVKAIINEYYSYNPYHEHRVRRSYFTLDDFDIFLYEHASEEDKNELINRYGREDDANDEESLYWASINVPEEFENNRVIVYADSEGEPFPEDVKDGYRVISKIQDEILKKYVTYLFEKWLDTAPLWEDWVDDPRFEVPEYDDDWD